MAVLPRLVVALAVVALVPVSLAPAPAVAAPAPTILRILQRERMSAHIPAAVTEPTVLCLVSSGPGNVVETRRVVALTARAAQARVVLDPLTGIELGVGSYSGDLRRDLHIQGTLQLGRISLHVRMDRGAGEHQGVFTYQQFLSGHTRINLVMVQCGLI